MCFFETDLMPVRSDVLVDHIIVFFTFEFDQ